MPLSANFSIVTNIIYAIFNFILGYEQKSYWFMTMGFYFLILAIMRIMVVAFVYKKTRFKSINQLLKNSSICMFISAIIIVGIVVLTIKHSITKTYHMYVMLAIALYSFFTFIRAIINYIRAKKEKYEVMILFRDINLISCVGSLLSLQRSMIGTFGRNDKSYILMEAITGFVSFIFIINLAYLTYKKSKRIDGSFI